MSVTRDGIWTIIECDGRTHGHACGEFDRGEGFEETWAFLNVQGWKAQKTASGWKHFCPACQNDSLSLLTKGLS